MVQKTAKKSKKHGEGTKTRKANAIAKINKAMKHPFTALQNSFNSIVSHFK